MPNPTCTPPKTDLCFNVTCPEPGDCESDVGTCDPATGVCSAAPPEPDGTPCGEGSCQGGVCTGEGMNVPRCCPLKLCSFDANPGFTTHKHACDYAMPLTKHGSLSNADLCAGVTCDQPGDCESGPGVCDSDSGLCIAPLQPDGTPCGTGSCQAGVCTGEGRAVPRCWLYGACSIGACNKCDETWQSCLPPDQTQTCALVSHALRLVNARALPARATPPLGCASSHCSQTARPAAPAPARPACA